MPCYGIYHGNDYFSASKIRQVIKKVIFSLVVLTLFSFSMHKYYVSITEAEYNSTSKAFEISIKFIGHDLEKALDNAGLPNLYLGTPKEHEKANEFLQKYIAQHFKMTVDGQVLNFRFIGKKINNDDFIYCFLESNQVDAPQQVNIKNSFLVELFNDQANTVYLKAYGHRTDYVFNNENVNITHEIKEKQSVLQHK